MSVVPGIENLTCLFCLEHQVATQERPVPTTEIQHLANTLLPCIPCPGNCGTNAHLLCHLNFRAENLTRPCPSCRAEFSPGVEKAQIILFAHLGLRLGETREERITRIQALLPTTLPIPRTYLEKPGPGPGIATLPNDFLPTKPQCMALYTDHVSNNRTLKKRFETEYNKVDAFAAIGRPRTATNNARAAGTHNPWKIFFCCLFAPIIGPILLLVVVCDCFWKTLCCCCTER